jgi:ribosomal protein L37AE/L43A
MPNFKNGDDLIKYIKSNTKKVIAESNAGETIDYECPYCKVTTNIIILKDGNGRCKKCNNVINITWEYK